MNRHRTKHKNHLDLKTSVATVREISRTVRYGTGIPGLPGPSVPVRKISRTFPYRPFPDEKFPVLSRTVIPGRSFPVATLEIMKYMKYEI